MTGECSVVVVAVLMAAETELALCKVPPKLCDGSTIILTSLVVVVVVVVVIVAAAAQF